MTSSHPTRPLNAEWLTVLGTAIIALWIGHSEFRQRALVNRKANGVAMGKETPTDRSLTERSLRNPPQCACYGNVGDMGKVTLGGSVNKGRVTA